MPAPELCVIFNPAAGKGEAARRLAKVRKSWGDRVDFQPTQRPGHATLLAEEAARAGFTMVAAAGGDGTVHEVANGLLRAGRPEVRFAVIPIGSANDYYASLEMDSDGAPSDANSDRVVDVGRVRSPGGREKYFVCCLGLGLNGAVTMESRKLKRLQGIALYGLATVRALWYHYGCPVMRWSIDYAPPQSAATLMLSVLVGKREGGFVMAPAASLSDGLFDFIHCGNLSRWEVLKFLPRLALAGPPASYPKITQGRCKKVTLSSESPLVVHVDGEFFCLPDENIRELEIEIMPAALRIGTLRSE